MVTQRFSQRTLFLRKEIGRIEWAIIKELVDNPGWIGPQGEATLRWALSLARLTKVISLEQSRHFFINSELDLFREELFLILDKHATADKVFDRIGLAAQQMLLNRLCEQAQKELLAQFSGLSQVSLNAAIETRPLVLALSGGGGAGYIFMGAMELLEEEGLIPQALAGNSIGSVAGAFRAVSKHFDLEKARNLLTSVNRTQLFYRSHRTDNRFTLPGFLELNLRNILGEVFIKDGQAMTLADLPIPFRVVVSGLSDLSEEENESYRRLYDSNASLRMVLPRILNELRSLASHRFKPLYLGADDESRQISVLDAIGISVSIPGLIYHDMSYDDGEMIEKIEQLLEKHKIKVLVDGGFVDNLPSEQAELALEQSTISARDPFVLALDCFAPNIRHMLFLPAMQFVAEKSKAGYEHAHHVIRFRSVLSPAKILPSLDDFDYACDAGRKETSPIIPYLKKILSRINR